MDPTSPSRPFFPSTTPNTSLPTRRSSPTLHQKISQLSLPLAPLVRLTTGETHPSFPKYLLNFHLLTSSQLDGLASFYHQRTPCEWTRCYPCPVVWDVGADLDTKRRRLGRFIGLRGCDSPEISGGEREREVEREIERRRARNEEEDVWRGKGRWY